MYIIIKRDGIYHLYDSEKETTIWPFHTTVAAQKKKSELIKKDWEREQLKSEIASVYYE